jgi:release factor family 10
MRELHSGQERERHHRFLEDVAVNATRLAGERDWERILITGEQRLIRPLVNALSNRLRQDVVRDSRHLTEIDGPVLAVAVAERLARERAERHLELVRRVRDAALGAGSGALGVTDVLVALSDARFEHLIYDPQVRYVGAVGADDMLLASPHAGGLMVEESWLTERIVERCLRTPRGSRRSMRLPPGRSLTGAASRRTCAGESLDPSTR